MAARTKIFTLNVFDGGSLERRRRVSSNRIGGDRWSVTLDANPLALDFDTKTLGRGVAQEISAHLQRRVSAIGATASKATLKKREQAAKALATGETWATRRYAGGRVGAMVPNQSDRMFNDSGRFVRGITANPTRGNDWVINVPANRLNATMLGGESALVSIVDKLRQYVPEFGSAMELMTVPAIRQAIKDASAAIVEKSRARAFGKFAGDVLKIALKELAS